MFRGEGVSAGRYRARLRSGLVTDEGCPLALATATTGAFTQPPPPRGLDSLPTWVGEWDRSLCLAPHWLGSKRPPGQGKQPTLRGQRSLPSPSHRLTLMSECEGVTVQSGSQTRMWGGGLLNTTSGPACPVLSLTPELVVLTAVCAVVAQ